MSLLTIEPYPQLIQEGDKMIDTYIDCNEYKRLIEEQKIKPAALKAFLKSNGIFLTSSNSKTLAESMYTVSISLQRKPMP